MKKEIKIADNIKLPADAVTQTFGFIGRKGSGKTYLASMVAEQMLDIEAQVIVLDCVGNWWGLRVDADGKSKGKEIFVIGGDHGDVPLVPEAGAKIAQLLVNKEVSAIIDVSGFRIGEHKRFAADFAEEFFHLKKTHRSPVHIFIEEAQKIIPQRVGPDEARMVGAFEQIVRLGRNYGIGCSLVTQRPQSVNKEVLSQVECLCVLQVTGPHERKALEEWVYEVGADRKLLGELPGLAQGEGYVWSPSWLRIYKRVHFAKKQTFDASATPVVGQKTRAASISAVDVEALKKDMADVVAKAEKDNPIALRKKIIELERELTSKKNNPIMTSPDARALPPAIGVSQWLEYGKKYQYDVFFLKKELTANDRKWQSVVKEWKDFATRIYKVFQNESASARRSFEELAKYEPISDAEIIHNNFSGRKTSPEIAIEPLFPLVKKEILKKGFVGELSEITTDSPDGKPLTGGAMRMLKVLVSRHPMQLTKSQLATFAKLKASSGSFSTYLATLKNQGLIQFSGSLYSATESGMALVGGSANAPQTTEEVIQMWKDNLSGGARRMFDVLIETYGQVDCLTKEEIAERTGLVATSGSFSTYLSMLKSNGLIEISGNQIRLSPNIFV